LQATRYRLRSHQQHHQFLQEKLATLDPREVLRRGYVIARTLDGPIVRSSTNLKKGQKLTLQLAEGSVRVSVTQIAPLEPLIQDQTP
jgi:exodeoxyribonuclease VII large subunit